MRVRKRAFPPLCGPALCAAIIVLVFCCTSATAVVNTMERVGTQGVEMESREVWALVDRIRAYKNDEGIPSDEEYFVPVDAFLETGSTSHVRSHQVKPIPTAKGFDHCYPENLWGQFDFKGWSWCKQPGHTIVGIYRSGGNGLSNIEQFMCCTFDRDRKATLKYFYSVDREFVGILSYMDTRNARDHNTLRGYVQFQGRQSAEIARGEARLKKHHPWIYSHERFEMWSRGKWRESGNTFADQQRKMLHHEQKHDALVKSLDRMDMRLQKSFRYEQSYRQKAMDILKVLKKKFYSDSKGRLSNVRVKLDQLEDRWKHVKMEQEKKEWDMDRVHGMTADAKKRAKNFDMKLDQTDKLFASTMASTRRLFGEEKNLDRRMNKFQNGIHDDSNNAARLTGTLDSFKTSGKDTLNKAEIEENARKKELPGIRTEMKELVRQIEFLERDVDNRMTAVHQITGADPSSQKGPGNVIPQSNIDWLFHDLDRQFVAIRSTISKEVVKQMNDRQQHIQSDWINKAIETISAKVTDDLKKEGSWKNVNFGGPGTKISDASFPPEAVTGGMESTQHEGL